MKGLEKQSVTLRYIAFARGRAGPFFGDATR